MSDIIQRIVSFLMSLLMPLLTSWGIAVKHFDKIENVKYDTSYAMDVYMPNQVSGNASGVLFLHDGNFKDGERGDMDNDCQIIANKGYVAATMDYALIAAKNNKTTLQTVMTEITNAIAALKSTAASKGVTLQKLALSGYGAGGYYALMYAYAYSAYATIDIQFVAVKGAPADFTYAIWKDVYSAADFAALVGALAGGLNLSADAFEKNTESARSVSASISPAAALDKTLGYGKIPTLAAYAGNDAQVPYANLTSLEAALVKNKVPHTLVSFPNSAHDFKRDILQSAEYSDALSNFCTQYFGS